MRVSLLILSGAALLAGATVASSPASAQGRGRNRDGVPPGQMPPAGLCRIWVDGVPPGRQPPPMDCREAERRAPWNSRVIYGSDGDRWGRGDRYDDRGRGGVRHRHHRDADDDDRIYDRSGRDRGRVSDGCLLRNNNGVCVLGGRTNQDGRRQPYPGQPVILGIPVPR